MAEVDALDEQAVERHLGGMVEEAGSIDVSFNAISIRPVQGTPLAEVANAAAFSASDRASAMTGTVANLTCGSIVD